VFDLPAGTSSLARGIAKPPRCRPQRDRPATISERPISAAPVRRPAMRRTATFSRLYALKSTSWMCRRTPRRAVNSAINANQIGQASITARYGR